MNIRLKTGQIGVLLAALVFVVGCGKNFAHQDQSSLDDPEYTNFSDLPMPDTGKDDLEELPVEVAPEVKPESELEVKPEAKPEVKPEAKPEVKPEPKPEVKPVPAKPVDSRKHADPEPHLKKVGQGIGTVYYLPVYGEKRNCERKEYAQLKDESDKLLAQLCKAEIWNCAMQGSCFYVDDKGVSLFAYKKIVKIEVPGNKEIVTQPRFRLNKEFTLCPQGMGAHRVCLDPYRSIAADPKFHKIGHVIYVPVLKGQKLPNNEIHDGYMVVRDTGGNIKGEGRFDFFIGFDDYRGHLFSKLGLADKKSGPFVYHLVPESIAEKVRKARRFPMAPRHVQENAYASMKDVLGLKSLEVGMQEATAFYLMKW